MCLFLEIKLGFLDKLSLALLLQKIEIYFSSMVSAPISNVLSNKYITLSQRTCVILILNQIKE